MSGVRSKFGGQERCIQGFCWGDLRDKDHFEDVGWEGMNWIDLAQDRNRRQAFVNTVMKLRVHKMRGIFRPAEEMLVCQEGLCPMEFFSWPSLTAFSPASNMHTVMTLCNKVRTSSTQCVAVFRAVPVN